MLGSRSRKPKHASGAEWHMCDSARPRLPDPPSRPEKTVSGIILRSISLIRPCHCVVRHVTLRRPPMDCVPQRARGQEPESASRNRTDSSSYSARRVRENSCSLRCFPVRAVFRIRYRWGRPYKGLFLLSLRHLQKLFPGGRKVSAWQMSDAYIRKHYVTRT